MQTTRARANFRGDREGGEESEKEKQKERERERRRKCAYYVMRLVPLHFHSRNLDPALSFKYSLGRNNVVWHAATGRDTCYRCQLRLRVSAGLVLAN